MSEERDTFECEVCGEDRPVTDRHLAIEVRDVCLDCVERCRDCGDSRPSDEMHDGYCEGCITACDCCGGALPYAEALRDIHGGDICRRCANGSYCWSHVEGGYVHVDDAVMAEDIEVFASREYAEAYWYYSAFDGCWYAEDRSGRPLGYTANVFQYFEWDARNARNALVFGVELEMEARGMNDAHDLVEELDGPVNDRGFILKEDGSLVDGVELVTVPLTLDQHRTEFGWAKILTQRLRNIAKSGSGTTNCGIHVHVNRRALSDLTLGKVMVFCNSPRTNPLVTTIAQRDSNGYAEMAPKKVSDVLKGTDRYERINVTGKGTVEFRLFRGNLRPERVLKNVEFCHAVIKFARATSARDMEKPELFLAWLSGRRKDYPNLYAFLVEKGWYVEGLAAAA